MKYRLLLRKGAESDLADAYRWYSEKVPGLGNKFLAAVEQTLDSIQINPAGYPIIYQTVRRALLHKFPYGIFYVWEHTGISVLAVMHTARDPAKWRKP
jgi:toxin ParE1/3/4